MVEVAGHYYLVSGPYESEISAQRERRAIAIQKFGCWVLSEGVGGKERAKQLIQASARRMGKHFYGAAL